MPQQPEIARSHKGATTPNTSSKAVATSDLPAGSGDNPAPIPEDNRPGHHPEKEQDKPDVRPLRQPRARRKADPAATQLRTVPPVEDAPEPGAVAATPATRFGFSFERRMVVPAALAGVTPYTSSIELTDGALKVRFGWWTLATTVDNIESVERTGPYQFFKVAGPPHLSLKDGGITFATTTEEGVCVRFRRPVACLVPFGLMRHSAMTITPDAPDEFITALERARAERIGG